MRPAAIQPPPTVRFSRLRRAVTRLFTAFLALFALGAGAGAAGAEHGPAPGSGVLFWNAPEGPMPLPLLDVDVDVRVTGVLARGTLTQRFRNVADRTVEAIYVFPLPERAAVHRMEMRIGPRRIQAIVQEREEARQTYVEARREGRKAALVEQQRPNLFTASAANVNPGETVEVVLEYIQEIELADGAFSFRFPLTYTPRFTPSAPPSASLATAAALAAAAPDCDGGPLVDAAHRAAPRAAIRVRIDAGLLLDRVESPSHEIETFLDGMAWDVRPSGGTTVADRDLVLRWWPLVDGRPEAALFVEDRPDGRYGLLVVVPPREEDAATAGLATETLFVTDVSGSMDGPSIEQARAALLAALERLRPDDTFNLLRFNDRTAAFSERFEAADDEALARARQWVRGLRASGGTEIHGALAEAVARLGRQSSDRVRRLVFLTDGAVSNEEQVFETIAAGLGEARLHAIGIGHAPNAFLMRKMATFGRGACTFIADVADARDLIDAFLARIARPVMSGITVEGAAIVADEVYPRRLPDLHTGDPLVVSFRLDPVAGDRAIAIRGRLPAAEVRETLELPDPVPAGSGVAIRWARARVTSLMDDLREGADPAMIRREVVGLGLDFGLVTRYTSLVAVEDFASALDDATALPVAGAHPGGARIGPGLPRGGTARPLLRRAGLLLALTGMLLLGVALRWRQP